MKLFSTFILSAFTAFSVLLGKTFAMQTNHSIRGPNQSIQTNTISNRRIYRLPPNQIARLDRIADDIHSSMETIGVTSTALNEKMLEIENEIRSTARMPVTHIDQIFLRIESILRTKLMPDNNDRFPRFIPRDPALKLAEFRAQRTLRSMLQRIYDIWIDSFIIVMDSERLRPRGS
ncbi:uncharacterized protein BBOV_IV011035 [Babesia bovis T2Bo]|uniref:uncharacterized protein n=1 Tax=Babesia bovis T2Bo TaxID=484906 RepID=UPI001D7F3652|nr:uncharacterized protein BBOV_IV011035 [Babesia bovis T2Bo]KAG6439940.1 hypothetical protein BBOV_IV011035 [Babesia bovis T2Bo]